MADQYSEAGNVAAFDEMKDNPVLVQQGTWTTFEQLSTELAEKGVIFTDLFTALQEHPDLVKRILHAKSCKDG